MLNWFTPKSVSRPDDVLNSEEVYDLTLPEWDNAEVLQQNDSIYLCVSKNYSHDKGIYEIIYRKDRSLIFSLFRSMVREDTEMIFKRVSVILHTLVVYIVSHKPTVIAPMLQKVLYAVNHYPQWTCAHISAYIGLDKPFVQRQATIIAAINEQNEPDCCTPLHCAILSESVQVVRAVLSLKPNINLTDRDGNLALHMAAASNREIFLLMINRPEAHAMLRVKNRKGCTPIHIACFASKYDNIREFLKHGVTVRMMTVSSPIPIVENNSQINESIDDDSKIIFFDKEILDDLDTEDMHFGGTPLHWAKTRRTVDRLIEIGFRLEVINVNNETALHVMTKRLRLKCMIGLLCYGASVHVRNGDGYTPLFYSVERPDISATQALIIFDSDINAVNNANNTVRHIAATSDHPDSSIVLYVLSAIGAKRCDHGKKGCTSGCAYDGDFSGTPYSKWPNFKNETFYKKLLLEHVIQQSLAAKKKKADLIHHDECKDGNKRARMICFDGGGVRGLITLQMLVEMEKQLKYPIANYFEWIAGTSTGAVIAMNLSMGKTLREIRDIYFRFKEKILVGSKPYSSANLEALLQSEFGPELKMSDIMNKYNKKLIITSSLIDRIPPQLHIFRSYQSPFDICGLKEELNGFAPEPNCDNQLAWIACRASGAAPMYFHPYKQFLDGGLIANNPTLDALTEFRLYNNALMAIGHSDEAEELELIISCGTGRVPITRVKMGEFGRMLTLNLRETYRGVMYIKNMVQMLTTQVCHTDGYVVDRAMAFCSWSNVPYFRVNPLLSEFLNLDETKEVEILNAMWETIAYMYAMRDQVNIIIQLLELDYHSSPNSSTQSKCQTTHIKDNPKPINVNTDTSSDNLKDIHLSHNNSENLLSPPPPIPTNNSDDVIVESSSVNAIPQESQGQGLSESSKDDIPIVLTDEVRCEDLIKETITNE